MKKELPERFYQVLANVLSERLGLFKPHFRRGLSVAPGAFDRLLQQAFPALQLERKEEVANTPQTPYDLVFGPLLTHPDDIPFFQRILARGGLLLGGALGFNTLKEWRALGLKTPTFVDMHDWGDVFKTMGFEDPVMDQEEITLLYPSVERMGEDFQWSGVPELPKHYSEDPEGYPVTLELVYIMAWRQKGMIQSTRDGEIIISVDELRSHKS